MAAWQDRLGHAEAQTTMGYTHADTADGRIADELGKILHVSAGMNKTNCMHRINNLQCLQHAATWAVARCEFDASRWFCTRLCVCVDRGFRGPSYCL
jgi:hypothetical protein